VRVGSECKLVMQVVEVWPVTQVVHEGNAGRVGSEGKLVMQVVKVGLVTQVVKVDW